MLREWDFHLFLKLAVTAGAQLAVYEIKRFLLTAHSVCPSVPHFFAFTAVYFCIPVQQTPTEQHLVCWFFVSAAHLLFCFFSTLSLVQHPTSHECKPAEGLCQEAQSSLPSGVPEQALDPFAQCLAKMGMGDVDNAGWRLLVLSGMVSLMCVVFLSMLLVSAPPACGSSHSEVARAVAAERGFFFFSGPLPNASNHCFCPRLPLWVWSKALPWRPSPDARVPSSHQRESNKGVCSSLPSALPLASKALWDGHTAPPS